MAINNEEVKKYYQEVESYDWAEAADKIVGPESFVHRWREKELVKIIKKFGAPKFLDLGCGTGLITRHLSEGSIGVDLNPRNLSKAKEHAPKAEFVLADIENQLPFDAETFSTVICTEVLEHLLFPEKTLSEIKRLLAKGGLLIGSVPSQTWVWKLRKLSFSRKHFSEEPFHRHFSKKDVENLFSPFFEIIKIYSRPDGLNWFFVCKKS